MDNLLEKDLDWRETPILLDWFLIGCFRPDIPVRNALFCGWRLAAQPIRSTAGLKPRTKPPRRSKSSHPCRAWRCPSSQIATQIRLKKQKGLRSPLVAPPP